MKYKVVAGAMLLMHFGLAKAQSGYVYGPDHCYHFSAPSGWQLDNQAAAVDGVPMVLYPTGSSWQSAPVVMYTQPTRRTGDDSASVQAQVNDVLDMYKKSGQAVKAGRIGTVRAKTGTTGELWSFSGYQNGGTELVVYFPGRETVNYFVAQISRTASLKDSRNALEKLATTYRESKDCQPCEQAGACRQIEQK